MCCRVLPRWHPSPCRTRSCIKLRSAIWRSANAPNVFWIPFLKICRRCCLSKMPTNCALCVGIARAKKLPDARAMNFLARTITIFSRKRKQTFLLPKTVKHYRPLCRWKFRKNRCSARTARCDGCIRAKCRFMARTTSPRFCWAFPKILRNASAWKMRCVKVKGVIAIYSRTRMI